jgi:SAM-dependent methyltransferase
MASDTFHQVYQELLSTALGPDSVLVDIGSKDGIIASQMSEEFGCKSVSIDLEFDLSEQLSTSLMKADGTQLPFRTNTVDAVISNMVFEHIPNEEQLISETSRVLKPDGNFVVIFPNRTWPFDSHGFPPGTPWIPRKVGTKLFSMASFRSEYYDRFMHPSSSIEVKRILGEHFGNVTFESDRLLDVDYVESRRGRLLRIFRSPISYAFSIPLLRSVAETSFPIAIYHAEVPN